MLDSASFEIVELRVVLRRGGLPVGLGGHGGSDDVQRMLVLAASIGRLAACNELVVLVELKACLASV